MFSDASQSGILCLRHCSVPKPITRIASHSPSTARRPQNERRWSQWCRKDASNANSARRPEVVFRSGISLRVHSSASMPTIACRATPRDRGSCDDARPYHSNTTSSLSYPPHATERNGRSCKREAREVKHAPRRKSFVNEEFREFVSQSPRASLLLYSTEPTGEASFKVAHKNAGPCRHPKPERGAQHHLTPTKAVSRLAGRMVRYNVASRVQMADAVAFTSS